MYRASRASRSLFLSILVLSLLSLAGCCKPCLRPILPVEPHPALRQVNLYQPGSPQAEYCLDDRGRRDTLVNLEIYRAALESSRTAIGLYNAKVKAGPK